MNESTLDGKLSLVDACALFNLKYPTLAEAVRTRRVPAERVGGRWRISSRAITDAIQADKLHPFTPPVANWPE